MVTWLALTNHTAPWSSWAMDTLIPHLKAFHKELHKQVTRRQAVRRVQALAGARGRGDAAMQPCQPCQPCLQVTQTAGQ